MELMFSFYCLCVSVRSAAACRQRGAIKLGFAQQAAVFSMLPAAYLFRDDGNGFYVSRILKRWVKGKVIKNIHCRAAGVLSHKIVNFLLATQKRKSRKALSVPFFYYFGKRSFNCSKSSPFFAKMTCLQDRFWHW